MCADVALPCDESSWRFCVLYFVKQCPGGSALAVECGFYGAFCKHIQDALRRNSRGREVRRTVHDTIWSLQASGHLSGGMMPELTDSGQNYLNSLTTPDVDRYRSLLDPEATSLTPRFHDSPGQPVAIFY